MNNILVVFFFVWLGGALWSVSQLFVDIELTMKWYWTLFFATAGLLTLGGLYYFTPYKHRMKCSFETLSAVILMCAFSQAVYGMLQWWGICYPNNGFRLTGSFDNPAGIASALAFSIPFGLFLLEDKRKAVRIFTGIALLGIGMAIVCSESRAGMLAAAVIVGVYALGKLRKGKKILMTGLFIGLAALTVVLYHFKKDSADGRLLIWQCTWEMIKDKPLLGYGAGGFEANYMNYQARYFREHTDSKYILLADDVKRPFNEYLRVIVDYGIIGSVLLLLVILGVVKLWLNHREGSSWIALLSLIGIAVFSLFSYPFRYPYTWVIGVFSVGILVFNVCSVSFQTQKYIYIGAASCMVILSGLAVKRMRAEMEWCRIANLSLLGKTEEVLPLYQKLHGELGETPLFLYNYTAELNVAGYYEESIRIGKLCEGQFADYFTQLLLADSYKNLKHYERAREHWILASEMCPNRFVPLYELYKMYEDAGDTLQARQVGDLILRKPVKVESAEIRRIIDTVKEKQHSHFYI